MNEFESPNYAEYSYERRAEGTFKLLRILLVAGYIAFGILLFVLCYISRVIPLFAVAPVFIWMLIFFTWKYVNYDYYFEFKLGILELGIIHDTNPSRKKQPKLNIHIKDALYIAPYSKSNGQLDDVKKLYDFSESQVSDKRILIVFNKDGVKCAAIFEGTAKIARLLSSFSDSTHDLKGSSFHG